MDCLGVDCQASEATLLQPVERHHGVFENLPVDVTFVHFIAKKSFPFVLRDQHCACQSCSNSCVIYLELQASVEFGDADWHL